MQRQNIIDLSLTELEKFCLELGLKPFKTKQIWNWIYCFGKTNFQEMTNLDKITLKSVYCINCGFCSYSPRPSKFDIYSKYKFLINLQEGPFLWFH